MIKNISNKIVKYIVTGIVEADYGCEEHPDGEPLRVSVYLEGKAGNEICVEAPDALLYGRNIDEGTLVTISEKYGILKVVHVVAAIIYRNTTDGIQIFVTQRGYGDFKDGWEFPGGKVEVNEIPEQALLREIREELDTKIEVEDFIDTVEYDYPGFHLSMDCFICSVVEGELKLKEHEASKWLCLNDLRSVDWLPADLELIDKLELRMKSGNLNSSYLIRPIMEDEYTILNDFLYEAVFLPEGVEPPKRDIIYQPELQVYVEGFGTRKDDIGYVAEVKGRIAGAVWVRDMKDYGHVEDGVPSFAISLYKEYRGLGLGTKMMVCMLDELRQRGYKKASLSVQKANYAVSMYIKTGFNIIDENNEEYIMVCELY